MKIELPSYITPELAEETGWHIGDGSMNIYAHKDGKQRGFYQLRGHIEDDVEHYESRIKPLFKKLYDLDISLRKMPKTRVFGFQLWNCDLVKFKQKLGLPLGKKFDIFIPEIFLEDDELKKAVIRGIFDTDGGIYLDPNRNFYPKLYIGTISEGLADQLLKLFTYFGLRATKCMEVSKRIDNRQQFYIVSIRGEEMFHKFMKIISPANPKHMQKYVNFRESKSL